MANGFCPYLLDHIGSLTKDANPMYKIIPPGFTNMLLTAGNPNSVRIDAKNGHKKSVQVKYRPRFTVQQTDTSKSCDNTIVPSYQEATISLSNVRQFAFHIEDETIAQYCEDASRSVSLGKPATSYMNAEIMDTIMSAANALLRGVDQDLISLITWGKNVVEGNNTATTVNISKDVQVQALDDGVTKLLTDYRMNYLEGRPQIVGSGNMYRWVLQQFAKNVDLSGIDSRIMAGAFDFHFDQNFETLNGSNVNSIGVFEPNSIQLVEYLEYQGQKAGEKPGASTFGVLPLPIQMKDGVVPVNFDFQLRYNDCEQAFTDAYSGSSLGNLEKGWNLILSKRFGLFQIPGDAYRHEDPSRSVNGALRYVITNDCDTCS